ncbi:nephrin-like isoform X2 [Physella acuta]|uniref:nephrin-like isoform X2 n=1 Tax=Physella acuta TaxID=109671 RepID=UPI0027DC19B4|nr:nephrin-like isoform X2 [Physella acuta]
MWHLNIALLVLFVVVEGVQHFIKKPQDAKVVQGLTAELECVIGDRKGAVQWTKDGFSLGFNSKIPGLDRYRIVSDRRNEFNLRITSVKLEDDAVYECQVLPKDGDGRLQARATLTVLVPPEAPRIIDYNNGSTLEVPYSQQTLELTCEARLGRPAATILWYKDDILETSYVSYGVIEIPDDKRETATSTIRIPLTSNNREKLNGATYQCEANNSAIIGQRPSTTVHLNILYPINRIEISGYNNRVVTVNETLVFTCISYGGNPLGQITWYRNDVVVQHNNTSEHSKITNVYTFKVRTSDNNAVYQCRAYNLDKEKPLIAEYKLKVQFPPTSVRISGANRPARSRERVTLTCESSNANPTATITWYGKNILIPRSEVVELYYNSSNGGQITRSEINVTVDVHDHGSEYTCIASNAVFNMTASATTTLNVLYPPPQAPIITQYTENTPIREGAIQKLGCNSYGGNPLSELYWYKGTRTISGADYKTYYNIASCDIIIIAKADDNNSVYKCKAVNVALNITQSASITLTVHFAPAQVTIAMNPTQPKAGLPLHLTCTSSSSNPPAEIVWSKNGRRITGENLVTSDAENGGKKTSYSLKIEPTSRDHNAEYQCRATNKDLDRSVSNAVTLNVLFKPEFDTNTLLKTYDPKLGDDIKINFTAYANPADVTYVVYKDGVPRSLSSRFQMEKGLFNISNLNKDDKGNYMVKGSNSIGFSVFNFTLNVKYPAEIGPVKNLWYADEGTEFTLYCPVSANPIIPNIITWSRENFEMSRTRSRFEIKNSTSYLTIPDLTRQDSGTFRCTADNRIGPPVHKDIKLLINFAPVIDPSLEFSKSAGDKGSVVNLKCRIQGVPDVSVTWSRNNNPILADSKYKLKLEKSKMVNYESTLQIRDLKTEDYGAYVCTATNSKGSISHSVTLAETSRPYPPYNIEFNNATSNSITISWKPSFNGGLPQSFRVRYKPVDARGYVYVDVRPYGATTYKIKGLELGTEYELTVLAFNDRGESSYQERGITARTSDVVTPADISTSELQGTDEIPVIIILVVCIVGVFILTLNVGLILFFIRRRKKRLEATSDTASHANAFELYNSTHKVPHPYPPPSDDTRSYGTYDKSMDDFSDDYIRDYDRECETHVFLPQQPDYPGSRPYSPQKIESPRLGSGHKIAYIIEDHPGRNSPWNEDPYQVAHPRLKKGYDDGLSNGDIYEYKAGMSEFSDRFPSRPSSRSGKTPPPPPTRSSSRGGFNNGEMMPPLPARNYEPQEISPQPRYGPLPGSSMMSGNIVPNPSYNGPIMNQRTPSPHSSSSHNTLPVGAEFRGHLV